ncbi:hypothetical protein [Clostridium sp. CF012]|uniref:hypothetical protein n=1 Tax=Clostridium sp. CF012 TaxID=2843319 RepID=UPI001C0BC7AE|nr:hypothetical protein [Clostridium sp. CF012]MBU3146735.1 hypothetical protein [Clostridium sp. CF012]
MKFLLNIQLVPLSRFGINLRTKLKKSDWDKIRKSVYAKEEMCCHICLEPCKSLDAHEVWNFNKKTQIQKLIGIIGICKACHNTIHYGRSQMIGYEQEAKEQFLKVNNCEMIDLKIELLRIRADYFELCKIKDWKLDLAFIEAQGYVVNKD